MKTRWFWTALGAIPFLAAMVSMQSCGGEGGPVGGDGGGGLPSITQAFLDLMTPEQRTASNIGSERCADCHGGRGDDVVYHQWIETKHADRNVGCERCHGPGGAHEDNPTKSNILTYPRTTSPIVCAQCHGNIYDQWNTSQHSKLEQHAVDNLLTSPNTARTSRCISCHSGLWRAQINAQGIDNATLSDSEILEIANNTLNDVPHSATCVSCHDPHLNTGNLTDDGKEVQLRKPVFNTDTGPIGPGASAASFTNFDHTCAQCHNGRGANPADSALNSGTSRPNMHDSNQFNMLMGIGGVEGNGPVIRNTAHANAAGQCSHCHMPDARHTATTSFDTGCAPCHTAADAAARVNASKNQIVSELLALRTRLEDWAIATFQNNANYSTVHAGLISHLWNYSTVISEEATELGTTTAGIPSNHQSANVPIQVKRARHNYYFVIRDASLAPHNAPYALHLLTVANQNIDELDTSTGGGSRSRSGGVSFQQMLRIVTRDREIANRADLNSMNSGG